MFKDNENTGQADKDISEIKECIKVVANGIGDLRVEQERTTTHAKNIAAMVNEYNQDNKNAHQDFYNTENVVIDLKARFEVHEDIADDNKSDTNTAKTNKLSFAAIIIAAGALLKDIIPVKSLVKLFHWLSG